MFGLELAARADPGLARSEATGVARIEAGLRLALVLDAAGTPDGIATVAAEQLTRRLEKSLVGAASAAERIALLGTACRDVSRANLPGARSRKEAIDLLAMLFTGRLALVASLGAARCFRVRGRRAEIVDPRHPDTRLAALGSAFDCSPVQVCALLAEPGDAFALCSMGVWASLAPTAIAGAICRADCADDACEKLIRAAWSGGGLASLVVAVVRLVPDILTVEPPGEIGSFPTIPGTTSADSRASALTGRRDLPSSGRPVVPCSIRPHTSTTSASHSRIDG